MNAHQVLDSESEGENFKSLQWFEEEEDIEAATEPITGANKEQKLRQLLSHLVITRRERILGAVRKGFSFDNMDAVSDC